MVGKTGIDEPVETLVALVVEKGANVAERLRGKAILVCQFTMQVGFFDIIARYDFFDVAIERQERRGRESDFFEIFGAKVEKNISVRGRVLPCCL